MTALATEECVAFFIHDLAKNIDIWQHLFSRLAAYWEERGWPDGDSPESVRTNAIEYYNDNRKGRTWANPKEFVKRKWFTDDCENITGRSDAIIVST